MKKCLVCGLPNTDDTKFCEGCGNQFEDDRNIFGAYKAINEDALDILLDGRKKGSKNGSAGADSAAQQTGSAAKEHGGNLIAPDETVQATIGVSYIQNLMSGAGFKNGAAILTDKRLYYFGKSFSNVGKGMNTATEESIISVDEITFTRFVHGSPLSYLIMAIICLLPGIMLFGSSLGSTDSSAGVFGAIGLFFALFGTLFLVAYFAGKSTVLEIAFPGGKYAFDARWHSTANMREFQRQIHVVKDSLKAGQNNDKNEKAEDSQ